MLGESSFILVPSVLTFLYNNCKLYFQLTLSHVHAYRRYYPLAWWDSADIHATLRDHGSNVIIPTLSAKSKSMTMKRSIIARLGYPNAGLDKTENLTNDTIHDIVTSGLTTLRSQPTREEDVVRTLSKVLFPDIPKNVTRSRQDEWIKEAVISFVRDNGATFLRELLKTDQTGTERVLRVTI